MTEKRFFIKDRQFLPGPTPVWSDSLNAELKGVTYHRSSAFKKALLSVREGLAPFFGSKNKPIVFTSSGTGAMDSSVVNLTELGDSVLIISGGKFSERWIDLCESYKCDVNVLEVPWGETCDLGLLEKKLEELPNLKVCFFQGTETSTGVVFPVGDICKVIKSKTEALIVVDGMTSLCSEENKMDTWQVDCMIGGSQKGFGVGAGLSFLALSDRALQNLSKREKFYFDYKREWVEQEKGLTAWSTSGPLFESLQASLERIHSFGLGNFIAQHRVIAQSLRLALELLGCSLFAKEAHCSSVTAFYPPKNIDATELLLTVKERYGAEISGGQGQLKNKILRLGHLGFLDPLDFISALTALEYALKDLGSQHNLGSSVSVFMESYYKEILA